MNLLVTGATGFVGRALVDRLKLMEHYRVRVAVRQPLAGFGPSVSEVVVPDLSARTDWRAALVGIDMVVHLAARVHVMREDPAAALPRYRETNVEGTLALARQAQAARVRRLIFLSSVKVNGEEGRFDETLEPVPKDPYGVSKHEAENGLRSLAQQTGLEVVIIRPPLVYGPEVKANFRQLMLLIARGVPLPLGAIRNRRSLVALDNLVDFVCTSLEHPAAGNETFFVSDGEDLSTPELIRHLAKAMHRPSRLFPVPVALLAAGATLLGKREMVQRLAGTLQVDITKAQTLLKWTPPVAVADAMRRTVTGARLTNR